MLKVKVIPPEFKPINIREPLTKACLLVESTAKTKVPVDTGTLRRSITTQVHDTYGVVGTNLEYAPYVEFGTGLFATNGDGRKTPWSYQSADGEWHYTRGMAPQPFLGPSLEENKKEIVLIFKEALDKEL